MRLNYGNWIKRAPVFRQEWYVRVISLFICKEFQIFCVFTDFRTGRNPILVATDVAARGLGNTTLNLFLYCATLTENIHYLASKKVSNSGFALNLHSFEIFSTFMRKIFRSSCCRMSCMRSHNTMRLVNFRSTSHSSR